MITDNNINLSRALRNGSFVLSLELIPSEKGSKHTADRAEAFAEAAASCGQSINAFSLTDNAGGRPGSSADAAAIEIKRRGFCPLIHITCRDSNRLGIQARINGLLDNQISCFFIVTGDYPANISTGRPVGVFDLDSVQAIKLAKDLAPCATVGAAVSPFKYTEEELMLQFFKMERKIAVGADFLICQLGFDARRFLEAKTYLLSRSLAVPLLGNAYIPTLAAARAMNAGSVPGCHVPNELLADIRKASEAGDERRFRLEIGAIMLAVFRGASLQGAHVGGFALKPDDMKCLLERANQIGDRWPDLLERLSYTSKTCYYAFDPPVTGKITATIPSDPIGRLPPARKSLFYSVMKRVYRLLFQPGSSGFRVMRSLSMMIDKRPVLYIIFHMLERFSKFILFRCQDCGDCALHDMAYCCPQSKCPKHQRNGPCGGSINGICEVDSNRRCVWTVIYRRLKGDCELEKLRKCYVPPRNTALEKTSGWINYFLGRDHCQTAASSREDISHPVKAPSSTNNSDTSPRKDRGSEYENSNL